MTATIPQRDNWATDTEIVEDDGWVLHTANMNHGRIEVKVTHAHLDRDFGIDASFAWTSTDAVGASESRQFDINIDDIPALVNVLTRTYALVASPADGDPVSAAGRALAKLTNPRTLTPHELVGIAEALDVDAADLFAKITAN